MDICDGILLIQVFLRSYSGNIVALFFAVIIWSPLGIGAHKTLRLSVRTQFWMAFDILVIVE